VVQIPKNIKVLSSKRGQQDGDIVLSQMTIKSSQITKTLQGQELLELYERLDSYKKILHEVKKALGDSLMDDSRIIDHILNLKKQQRAATMKALPQIEDRYQMQIEDLNSQLERMTQNFSDTQQL